MVIALTHNRLDFAIFVFLTNSFFPSPNYQARNKEILTENSNFGQITSDNTSMVPNCDLNYIPFQPANLSVSAESSTIADAVCRSESTTTLNRIDSGTTDNSLPNVNQNGQVLVPHSFSNFNNPCYFNQNSQSYGNFSAGPNSGPASNFNAFSQNFQPALGPDPNLSFNQFLNNNHCNLSSMQLTSPSFHTHSFNSNSLNSVSPNQIEIFSPDGANPNFSGSHLQSQSCGLGNNNHTNLGLNDTTSLSTGTNDLSGNNQTHSRTNTTGNLSDITSPDLNSTSSLSNCLTKNASHKNASSGGNGHNNATSITNSNFNNFSLGENISSAGTNNTHGTPNCNSNIFNSNLFNGNYINTNFENYSNVCYNNIWSNSLTSPQFQSSINQNYANF